MRRVEHTAYVLYSAAEMYALVNDIKAYPDFLPWCHDAEIFNSSATALEGQLEIKKGPWHYSLVTRNTMVPNERIDMHLMEGTLKHLEGDWSFLSLEETACKITFRLEFEFGRMVDAALESLLDSMSNTIFQAFIQRAHTLYGER